MKIRPFGLERYFADYEFNVPYIISASDCESLSLRHLLDLADAETMGLWERLSLGYTESQGHPLLRQEVARLYSEITPADVLIVAPEEGIFITMHALLEPGDHVIVTFPGYQSLYSIAEALGCRVTRWELEAGEVGWRLDLGLLEEAITPLTKLLVVNFPHNPTGYLPARDQLDAILDLARRHNLYVFSDEMYRLLEYDAERQLPAVCDLYEKGISLFGLSKSFSLPGLRIGWLATSDRPLLARMQMLKDYTTICSSAPSEVLGIIAVRAKDRIIRRNLRLIRDNIQVAGAFFAENADWFIWLEPQAGSIAFPRLTGDIPVNTFCEEVLQQKGVLIVPGTLFELSGNHFRLGLGRRNLPQALSRLGEYIDAKRRT
jgi:aspartate/methionine/tyrosine aminotransferase